MTRVGYCSECDKEVPVADDGSCPAGHAQGGILDIRETTPETSRRDPGSVTPRRAPALRWPWIAAGIALVLVIAALARGAGTVRPPSPPEQTAAAPAGQPARPPKPIVFKPPGQTIRNASFERWSDGRLEDWRYSSVNAVGGVSRRPDWRNEGSCGVGLVNDSRDPAEASELWQPVLVDPGQRYALRVFFVSDRQPASIQLCLRFLGPGDKVLRETVSTGDEAGHSAGAMKPITLTAEAPSGAVTARIVLRLAGGRNVNSPTAASTAVFDDVTLAIVSE